jgi:hypothetical protein
MLNIFQNIFYFVFDIRFMTRENLYVRALLTIEMDHRQI